MYRPLFLALAVLVSSCQTPPDLQTLKADKDKLQQQLDTATDTIGKLEAERVLLNQQLDELNRVVAVLGQEKSSRVTESTNLRGQVRQFVQSRIDSLKDFLLASNLVDYIGGELVERSVVDDKALLLIDLNNSVPRDGTLTGVAGYFHGTGQLTVKVLRAIDGRLVVVWSSQAIEVTQSGLQRLSFPVSVGVERGDRLGFYLSSPGLVSFDTGTGNTRYLTRDLAVGDSVKTSNLQGEKDKRAYSLGVFGLLNAE